MLDLERPVKIETVSFTFQGGFVGTECQVFFYNSEKGWVQVQTWYPQDVNSKQVFSTQSIDQMQTSRLKLLFNQSSDFYGRITVYSLDVCGVEVEE
jgi:hypothetical protein